MRRRFVELHEDALDNCGPLASICKARGEGQETRTLDLWMPGAVILMGDMSLGGLKRPVDWKNAVRRGVAGTRRGRRTRGMSVER